jgi:hypothetical protein
MSAVETARAMVAEVEAMLARHKDALAAVEAEVAAEAARVPTVADLRELVARMA